MPKYDPDTGEPLEDTEEDPDAGQGPKGLRAAKAKADERVKALEAELEEARQAKVELAFTRANLPEGKVTDFFRGHYDGPLEADAIRAAAAEAGITLDASTASEAAAGQAQMSQAFSGSEITANQPIRTGVGTEVPAEEAEMWEEYERVLKEGVLPGGDPQAAMYRANEVLRRHRGDQGQLATEPIRGGAVPAPMPINTPGHPTGGVQ